MMIHSRYDGLRAIDITLCIPFPFQIKMISGYDDSFKFSCYTQSPKKRNFPNSIIFVAKLSRYKNKMIQNVCLHIQNDPYGTFTREPYNPTQS